MGMKRGVDRLSIVLAVIVMIAFASVIIVVGWTEGFASMRQMVIVIIGAAVISVLATVFGIRGIAYLILWVVNGFKEENRVEK